MIVCGHQPNFLPYPGFFHKLMNCDRFVLVDNVEFVGKGPFGWIHRNQIRLHNKDEHWLTVPVLQKGRFHQDINEVEINNDEPWRRKHWKSIRLNYQKSDYFDRYSDEVESIYDREWNYLAELNIRFLEFFIDALEIQTPVDKASEEGITGESTQLIINLCEAYDSETYLSGQHGRDYLDQDLIDDSGIEVLYQDYEAVPYEQVYDGFVPNLSTLDLLFNCGPESREIIESGGTISGQ